MIYQFKQGQTYHGVDAQTAGEELERIRLSNHGKLKPENVLESAQADESPLHDVFTWDDKKAAHEYRLTEVRQFIRAVVTVGEAGKTEPAFWNIIVSSGPQIDESERYYQSASVIASNPGEYQAALRVMLMELASAQNGLEKLRSLAPRGQKSKVARAHSLLESAHEALR